jgi:hypothetical protein
MNWLLIKEKLRAFGLHFGVSFVVAALTALLIFGLWYPNNLASYVGGTELYGLVLLLELGLGPVMSLVIYNSAKPSRELIRDYCIVGFVQLSALVYGLYVVAESRPVYLIFVKDRFEVVTAIELDKEDYAEAIVPEYAGPTWFGPERICVEYPTSPQERNHLLFSAIAGKDVQLFPKYYRECLSGEVEAKAYSSEQLEKLIADSDGQFNGNALPEGNYTWLPVTHRFGAWVEVYPEASVERAYFLRMNPFN